MKFQQEGKECTICEQQRGIYLTLKSCMSTKMLRKLKARFLIKTQTTTERKLKIKYHYNIAMLKLTKSNM